MRTMPNPLTVVHYLQSKLTPNGRNAKDGQNAKVENRPAQANRDPAKAATSPLTPNVRIAPGTRPCSVPPASEKRWRPEGAPLLLSDRQAEEANKAKETPREPVTPIGQKRPR